METIVAEESVCCQRGGMRKDIGLLFADPKRQLCLRINEQNWCVQKN